MTPTYQSGFAAPGRGVPKYPELWKGCVGAWNPGLGNSGLILRDWSGRKNNGTLTNGPTWVPSDGKTALSFDGVNDYVSIPSFRYGTSFSVSIWVQPSALVGAQMILTKKVSGAGDANQSIQFFTNGSDVHFRVFSGVDKYIGRTAASVITTAMQHLVTVYDGGTTAASIKIYRNGIQVDAADSSGGVFTVFNDATIRTTLGVQNIDTTPQNYFAGRLNDMLIYGRAIATNQIKLLATRPGIAYEMAPRKSYFLPPSPSSQFYDVLAPSIFAGSI